MSRILVSLYCHQFGQNYGLQTLNVQAHAGRALSYSGRAHGERTCRGGATVTIIQGVAFAMRRDEKSEKLHILFKWLMSLRLLRRKIRLRDAPSGCS